MIGHYLMFNRNCQEAISTYEKAFGAKVLEMQKYGDMPPNPDFPIADSDKELVLNARIEIAGIEFMCADMTNTPTSGDNMYVTVTTKDSEIVKNAWNLLKEEGKVFNDLQPSFFAELHGSLQDKFGINWMFTLLK